MENGLVPAGRWVKKVLRGVTAAAFLLTISIATVQIISRYLPNDFPVDFLWTGELATNLLVFVIFFGAVLAELDGGQLRIDIVRNQIESMIGSVYELLVLVTTLVFTGLVVYGAYTQAQASWSNTGLVLTWFRTGYLYAFILIAFVLLSGLRLWRAGVIVRTFFSGGARPDEKPDSGEDDRRRL
jgi:TRAP-type C4-dicarboxylate transport system permease small subunit